jgi:hypothetical protein
VYGREADVGGATYPRRLPWGGGVITSVDKDRDEVLVIIGWPTWPPWPPI